MAEQKSNKDSEQNTNKAEVKPEVTAEKDLSQQQALDKLSAEIKAQNEAEKSNPDNTEKVDTSATKSSNSSATKEPIKAQQVKKESTNTTSKKASPSKTTASVSSNVTAKKPLSLLALFSFILSLISIGVLAWFWWQSQIWLNNQQQMEQLKQQNVLTNQQTISQLQSRITELQNAQTQQQNRDANAQQTLNALTGRIKDLGQSQPNYWLASEAGYLINLAERRLLIEQDVNTSVQLLLDANQRLTKMQDPSVFHIRTAISEDVASLYAIKQPNTDDIYLALSGLLAQVQTMPFAHVYIPQPEQQVKPEVAVSNSVNDWQQNLKNSLAKFFGNFIKISRRDAAVQPQLPVDQQWYVRSNLTTQILMAQTAVLDKNAARYNDAMANLSLWSHQYFDTSNDKVVAFVNTAAELATQDVRLALPTGLNAQPLISKYLTEQLNYKEANND